MADNLVLEPTEEDVQLSFARLEMIVPQEQVESDDTGHDIVRIATLSDQRSRQMTDAENLKPDSAKSDQTIDRMTFHKGLPVRQKARSLSASSLLL